MISQEEEEKHGRPNTKLTHNLKMFKHFKAPHASQIEGRVGTFYQASNNRLRLDIGNSFDLYDKISNPYVDDNDNKYSNRLSLGGDFYTFTRIRSEGRLKFPVETTDYYFGINSTYNFHLFGQPIYSRFRIAHISSHMIDGLADKDGQFIEGFLPFTYSREFIDLLFILDTDYNLRPYIGLNTIFSTIPDNVNTFEPQMGFDYSKSITNVMDMFGLSFEAGYDLRLLGQDNIYRGSNSFQTGLKLRTQKNKGIYLGYYYFAGHSMHGMFIGRYDEYSGIGFQIYY